MRASAHRSGTSTIQSEDQQINRTQLRTQLRVMAGGLVVFAGLLMFLSTDPNIWQDEGEDELMRELVQNSPTGPVNYQSEDPADRVATLRDLEREVYMAQDKHRVLSDARFDRLLKKFKVRVLLDGTAYGIQYANAEVWDLGSSK